MDLTLVIISGSICMICFCMFIILAVAWSRRKVNKYPRYQAPELAACEPGGGSQFEDEYVGLSSTHYEIPECSSDSSDCGGCDGGGD